MAKISTHDKNRKFVSPKGFIENNICIFSEAFLDVLQLAVFFIFFFTVLLCEKGGNSILKEVKKFNVLSVVLSKQSFVWHTICKIFYFLLFSLNGNSILKCV